MISAPYLRSCSANNMTSSSTSSIEFLHDIVHRNQTNDWISQLSAAVTRPLCPPPPQPLTPSQLTNATTENYFRCGGISLGRSLSTPEPKNWNETSLVTSDESLMTSGDFRSPSSKVGKSERYKTELCRSYEETGFCKYKEKCQFAHGSQELRNVQRHPKYKTDRCRTYHSTGFCPYGSRCHFVHDEQAMMMNRGAPVGYGAPPPPSLELSTPRSSPELLAVNDLLLRSSKVNDYEGGHAVLPDQMNQLLEALSRAFLAVSSSGGGGGGCPSQGSSSPSPTLSSFEMTTTGVVLQRQDSLASGSVRSSPERLPTPTSVMRGDDYGMMTSSSSSSYSRISSCSNDYDVIYGGGGGGSHVLSPVSPTTHFYPSFGSNDGGSSSSAFSSIWARTAPHPFSTLFEV